MRKRNLHEKEIMFEKLVPCYISVFTFLKLITLTHLTLHDSSHGFITKNARYLIDDDISYTQEEISYLRYLENLNPSGPLNIRFEPEFLDFRERPLGVPYSETVTVFNTDNNKTIDLTSISGNTVHFHSSFFEDKTIPPNGNTTFKIVYLGRQEGPVESSIFLHTSTGFLKYNVKAFGIFSKYRVRPIVGVKLPANSTFTPVIYMHNPHSEPIQIVEIYSSGGGFHLELPGGQHEGSNDLWEIEPQETKAIIRVRFEAKVAENHTAYIRIKVHNPDEILIVPLEVEVTPAQNIFHPQGHVDFGMGGSMDPPKEISLCLFNPLRKPVRVHSVSTLSKSIKTQYYNVRIGPGNEEENKCVNVGTLTIDWKNAWKNQDFAGNIIVKFRNGKNRTEIPYYVTALKGGLSYDKLSTTYFLNDKEIDTTERKFEVLNEFLHPVKIVDVKFPFDVDSTFKIETFTPKIVRPLEKEHLFNIRLKSAVKKTNMQLSSHIKLITNVSEVQVPLLSYNGKVQVHLPFTSNDYSLNVGLVGSGTTKEIFFMLSNPNPVDLPLLSLQSFSPLLGLGIKGCGTGDHKTMLLLNTFKNLTDCDRISSYGFAIIKMAITTGSTQGPVWEKVQIQTPYENLSLPVHFKVSSGTFLLDTDELVFDKCFPTKTCSHLLKVYSTFPEQMLVENILALPLNKKVSASITAAVTPNANKIIGQMFFNPNLDCGLQCYVGFLNEGSASWLRTLPITKQVLDYDLQLVKTLYNRYLNFTKRGSNPWTNISLRLDTSEIKGYFFQSKVKYIWPSLISDSLLLNNSTLEFPLAQVGNTTRCSLLLHNPSDQNVIVQILFDFDYPEAEKLFSGLPENFVPFSEFKYPNKGFFFDRRFLEQSRDYFWDISRIPTHKTSLPVLLLPNQSKKIFLEFEAEESKTYSSLILLRNNLTILEVVRLKGKGSVPVFKLGNRKQGTGQPLLFDINEKSLQGCVKEEDDGYFLNYVPNLTVKRSISAKNLGEIPVQVYGLYINGYQCEGFGFKVLNCDPFTLPPNSTKRIEIAFTSDLTLTKVSRTLILTTSLNTFVNYSLYATIPYVYCQACDKIIARPPGELYMSYITIVFMKVMFFLIMFIAVLDAEAIKRQAWDVFITSNAPPMLPVLDLRKIGRQVKDEMQFKDKKKSDVEVASEVVDLEAQEVVKNEPAIVPTTGKAKRKLAQRNSFNEDEVNIDEEQNSDKQDKDRNRERQTKKDLLFERHRLKSRERKTEKELKLLEEKERKEKHAQQKEAELKRNKTVSNKKTPKSTQEEESSSTTTESSNSGSNCEEVDKENQTIKSLPKKKTELEKSAKPKEIAVNLTEYKNKHVSFVNSKLKGKTKQHEHDGVSDRIFSHNRESKRRGDKLKGGKEKSCIYRNKSLNERRSKTSESESGSEKQHSKSPVSFYIPFPAPTTTCSSAWCENRARFSDVVARTEQSQEPSIGSLQPRIGPVTVEDHYFHMHNISNSRQNVETLNSPLKQPSKPMSMKPTMYVEPYKPVDLGPIGSKRLGTPGIESPDLFFKEHRELLAENYHQGSALNNAYVEFSPMNDKSVIAAISNNTLLASDKSFFSQPQGVRMEGAEGNLFKNVAPMEMWNHQQPAMQQPVFNNVIDQSQRLVEPDKHHMPLNEPPIEDPWNRTAYSSSTDYWSNTFSDVLDSTPRLESNTLYLWDPVWKPWSPADVSTATPRRTPPGFDEQIQMRRRTEEEQRRLQQRGESYSPFGSGCTWAEQKDPWE